MKAITLWQPWASLWAIQAKKYETRSWATNYRGQIAIHSAKKDPQTIFRTLPTDVQFAMSPFLLEHFLLWDNVPLGAILGYGELVDCHLMTPELIAKQTPQELLFGDWTPGRYAWEIANVKLLPEPVPYKGAQGLWRIPNAEEILKGVL